MSKKQKVLRVKIFSSPLVLHGVRGVGVDPIKMLEREVNEFLEKFPLEVMTPEVQWVQSSYAYAGTKNEGNTYLTAIVHYEE